MENFCRKMTISCYLMFQILGAGSGSYTWGNRSCVIPHVFWHLTRFTRNSRTPHHPQIESNSLKLKNLSYVYVRLLHRMCLRCLRFCQSCEWGSLIKIMRSVDSPLCCNAGLCNWGRAWSLLMVTTHPQSESRTILQRMSSEEGEWKH